MKKFTLLLAALLLTFSVSGQQFDSKEQTAADWRKMAGMEGPHRFDTVRLSKAPKGYKPFYISHYGRHGSRYAWNADQYTYIHNVFTDAHDAGALTALGEDFHRKYESFYLIPYINAGDLVPLGYEQHRRLGDFTYKYFKNVFKGDRKIFARSSTGQRCIVSMSAYCLSLMRNNTSLDISQAATHDGMSIIAPPSVNKILRRSFKGQDDTPSVESIPDFNKRVIDYDGIISRLFTNSDFITRYDGGSDAFCAELFSFLGGYHNYSEDPIFDGILTPEQMAGLWESSNYGSYYRDITARYAQIPLLEDILIKADEAMSDPSIAAHLRFGHDYIVESFLCLINANGCGTVTEKAEEAKYWFQNYNIPMGTTVLFVFYRNRTGDVLFKLVWNEEDATLPDLRPVEGCYYRWSDFCAYARNIIAAHPQIQSK